MTRPRDFPDPTALGFEWPKVQKALAEYRRLLQARTDAMAEQANLRRERQEAERADADAHVAAIRAGKGDPGTPREDAVKVKIEASERKVKALIGASEQAEAELLTVVTSERDVVLAEAELGVTERRAALAAAVEEWGESRTRLAEAVALREYLATFPDGRFKVGGGGYLGNRPHAGPFGASTPPPTFIETLEALRRDAEAPPERVQPANVKPLRPTEQTITATPVGGGER